MTRPAALREQRQRARVCAYVSRRALVLQCRNMGSVEATAEAVREIGRGLRAFGFRGRSPNSERPAGDGSVQLVNLQRVNAGVTGRDPGFTVNLNVVHGAVLRAWRATDMIKGPVRSAQNVGLAERLGSLAFGYDHWWHPLSSEEASGAAREVLALMETHGLPWLDRMTDPDTAIAALLPMQRVLWHLEAAAALLVERPGDQRRAEVLQGLRRWGSGVDPSERALCEWLVTNLA